MTDAIRTAIQDASAYLTEHPGEARYTDSLATARIESGLRIRVTGPQAEELVTDMPGAVGGSGSAPSPGWFLRAAVAACVTSLAAMRAAQLGIDGFGCEVDVDSESDDRGILGLDANVPAGPLSTRIVLRVTAGRHRPGPPARRGRMGGRALSGLRCGPACSAAERRGRSRVSSPVTVRDATPGDAVAIGRRGAGVVARHLPRHLRARVHRGLPGRATTARLRWLLPRRRRPRRTGPPSSSPSATARSSATSISARAREGRSCFASTPIRRTTAPAWEARCWPSCIGASRAASRRTCSTFTRATSAAARSTTATDS